ncbi:2-hydroxychromene-2-carboxylate isomerase [Amycolatopsis cihanbeyliensis]|uniref:2-hydroxychromene-2-carboxylate isomerase n=1 Tax=Amycolatopsis cihanbeyliensis TaxID=1128664 RepID=A0A542DE65_AMYCI|nr:DsbA family protein [Amycolatopsis cihanbeyliensis]TQJ01368.1 2-hydroxychromene-2-carboxylate isomerase [Amycolatopsis cihanbeyliensis]
MAAAKRNPRWYFSLRSPYSWLAYRDLVTMRPDVLDAIEWLPFWEPDARTEEILSDQGVTLPTVAMSRAKNFYILQDTRRLTRARGLHDITWPIDQNPCWEVAHLAWILADDEGRGKDFAAAAYRARWEQNKNISDPEVIAEIAAEFGLDSRRLAGAAEDEDLRKRGAALLERSARDGMFGVPFFISGREKFWGLDRVSQFVSSLTGEPEPEPATLPEREPAPGTNAELLPAGADAGHAGGCG